MAETDLLTKEQTSLYERDFVLWVEEQARLLRDGRLDQLDLANLIEEIESMGRSARKAIKNNLIVVLTHLLKYQLQPTHRSNSWRASIVEHRRRIRDDIEDSPSLRQHLNQVFARAYADARVQATAETGLSLRTFPAEAPWTLEETLDPDFLPD